MKLSEVEHDYYCNDANYFGGQCLQEFSSWQSFLDEQGDADMDYNLLFRWDWRPAGEDWGLESDTLCLYYVGQRKGLFRIVHVSGVTKADEAEIRAWLSLRWEHLVRLWSPVSSPAREGA